MEPELATAYRLCQNLHRQHGRTYYLATRLLPAAKRRHIYALYGFARYADEIVDRTEDLLPAQRAERFQTWSEQFLAGLTGAPVTDPLLPAVLDTIAAYRLDHDDFASFLKSMAMDLTVTDYQTYPELLAYMEGSAAVIGTMVLPVLDPTDPARAREPARQLGLAFQLTNFIRDVAEDLQRGRIYLPREDLDRYGVSRASLIAAVRRGGADPPIRALIRHQVRRARRHYEAAAAGVPLLAVSSQACIRTAYHLYAAILDEVARANYDVFRYRAVVPNRRRAAVALRSLLTRPGTPVIRGWPDDPPRSR